MLLLTKADEVSINEWISDFFFSAQIDVFSNKSVGS